MYKIYTNLFFFAFILGLSSGAERWFSSKKLCQVYLSTSSSENKVEAKILFDIQNYLIVCKTNNREVILFPREKISKIIYNSIEKSNVQTNRPLLKKKKL